MKTTRTTSPPHGRRRAAACALGWLVALGLAGGCAAPQTTPQTAPPPPRERASSPSPPAASSPSSPAAPSPSSPAEGANAPFDGKPVFVVVELTEGRRCAEVVFDAAKRDVRLVLDRVWARGAYSIADGAIEVRGARAAVNGGFIAQSCGGPSAITQDASGAQLDGAPVFDAFEACERARATARPLSSVLPAADPKDGSRPRKTYSCLHAMAVLASRAAKQRTSHQPPPSLAP